MEFGQLTRDAVRLSWRVAAAGLSELSHSHLVLRNIMHRVANASAVVARLSPPGEGHPIDTKSRVITLQQQRHKGTCQARFPGPVAHAVAVEGSWATGKGRGLWCFRETGEIGSVADAMYSKNLPNCGQIFFNAGMHAQKLRIPLVRNWAGRSLKIKGAEITLTRNDRILPTEMKSWNLFPELRVGFD